MNNLSIHHEDEDLLVLNKPSGIHSAHNPKSEEPSVAQFLIENFPALKSVADKPEDAGLVHRLDKETSGLLIAAKTKTAWQNLRTQFKENTVTKLYIALIEGQLSEKHIVENFIGSPYRRGKKVRVYIKEPSHGRIQRAHSTITPLNYLKERDRTWACVQIHTGVRHQVRAHCSFLSHPLIGDALYGSETELDEMHIEDLSRDFLLHAWKVGITHPKTNKRVTYTDTPSWTEGISSSLLSSIS